LSKLGEARVRTYPCGDGFAKVLQPLFDVVGGQYIDHAHIVDEGTGIPVRIGRPQTTVVIGEG